MDSVTHKSTCHLGGHSPCEDLSKEQEKYMQIAQVGSFLIVNYLAAKAIPKLYAGAFALGAAHEYAAQNDYPSLLGKCDDRWVSKKYLNDCGGGCAALIGVISGINVSKLQGFIVGAAFYASHISHQATILVPVTGFVAGQKAVNFYYAQRQETTLKGKDHHCGCHD
ncbi:MAG: hypothetical protein HRU43_01600 [Simkaniaceae bacterium]|nr:hypothetical protein [Simkaniaceae bacterium]